MLTPPYERVDMHPYNLYGERLDRQDVKVESFYKHPEEVCHHEVGEKDYQKTCCLC